MAFVILIDLILFIALIYFLIKWIKGRASNESNKYKVGFWLSFGLFILFIIISGMASQANSYPSSNTNQSSKHTSKPTKMKETYMSVKPIDDTGDGETTFNKRGKAVFNIFVHKGTNVYFNDDDNTYKQSNTNDGKYANLKRINPTHYQVIMNYQPSADDSSADGNSTNISAKSKDHTSQSIELDGDDNSSEIDAINQKKQAKLNKEYPHIQDKLQGMSNNQLFTTQAMVKGKVLSWGAQNDGSGMILIKDSAGNEFTLEPNHRVKGIKDGSTIVAYGGNFDKQKINDSQTNNAISSEYLGDNVINMPSIDHIKLISGKGDV